MKFQPSHEPERRLSRRSRLLVGLTAGIAFGFLLQKGGAAKFELLIGALLLEEFAVFKIILAAILTGMIGVHLLHRAGLVELHIKPTRYAANAIGGLLFGIGFGLAAYCPGTGAAALGQGNYDALPMMGGMLVGSYVFAELSAWLARRVEPIGDRGKLTLHGLLALPRAPFLVGMGAVLAVALTVLSLGRFA